MLSILLPVYRCNCVALVTELQRQCVEAEADFEIIVADDGSLSGAFNTKTTYQHLIDENKVIEHLKRVRYIIREKNVGRSAIRNFLVSQSKGERILFIDGDLSLDNPSFISNYLQTKGDIVVGGITIGGSSDQWKGNLRYHYERQCETLNTVKSRQSHPY